MGKQCQFWIVYLFWIFWLFCKLSVIGSRPLNSTSSLTLDICYICASRTICSIIWIPLRYMQQLIESMQTILSDFLQIVLTVSPFWAAVASSEGACFWLVFMPVLLTISRFHMWARGKRSTKAFFTGVWGLLRRRVMGWKNICKLEGMWSI